MKPSGIKICAIQGALWQMTNDDFQCSNVDLRFVFCIHGVKGGGACSRQNIWMTMPKNWLIVGISVRDLEGFQS